MLGYLQGTHWVYQKALYGHKNNSYAREAVDRPRRFIVKTACRLAVEVGSCVDDEAYGWAWKPYGWFDPAPRPRDIIHTYIMADGPVWRTP